MMCYLALACDFDGTLATHGQVDERSLLALERLLASGRKLILVTGRELTGAIRHGSCQLPCSSIKLYDRRT